jgi:hypothetical protein
MRKGLNPKSEMHFGFEEQAEGAMALKVWV